MCIALRLLATVSMVCRFLLQLSQSTSAASAEAMGNKLGHGHAADPAEANRNNPGSAGNYVT
jgi:hypothetical protein